MTGDCYSERANELILNCALRVYVPSTRYSEMLSDAKLNGKPHPIYGGSDKRHFEYHSPIEIFIFHSDKAKNTKLIEFLKGEREKLTVEDLMN